MTEPADAQPPDPTPAGGAARTATGPVDPAHRRGFRAFWTQHRALFWMLHSLWALATGVAVIVLARERYGFVPWVVLFLALTWASTLFFGRRLHRAEPTGGVPDLRAEATSYATRTMYQETLFFLLPFYWYSTVPGSVNLFFTVLLGGLAVLSCIDLLFDRLVRSSPVFGLVFFATVAFAAVNLILPILLPVDPMVGTSLAAAAALGSAVPLAAHAPLGGRAGRTRVALASLGILVLALGFPRLIPPVPLRVQETVFASGIDRETLATPDTLGTAVGTRALEGVLVLVAEVFAPSVVSTEVSLEWRRDGELLRTSRTIEIQAHDLGFRVWDSWRPEAGPVVPGRYHVVMRTGRGRVFGMAEIAVTAGPP